MMHATWMAVAITAGVATAAYADPRAALAKEPLAGTVLVQANAQLWPTAAEARADHPPGAAGQPYAVAVVKDHGDVVEVSTARVTDCVASFAEPYEVHVFVARSALVPRAGVETVTPYRDGTAVAIDRGAPVELTATGVRWHDTLLAATGIAPDASRLRLSIDHWAAASLPAASGQPLACGDTGPMTADAWQHEREAEAKRKAREEEHQREECERQAREQADASAAKQHKGGDDDQAAAIARLLTDSSECDRYSQPGLTSVGPRQPPACGVRERISWDAKQLPAPTLDGKPIDWATTRSDASNVYGPGTYLADLRAQCGAVRVQVVEQAVAADGNRVGSGHGGDWWLETGPVTWPDGKPAGQRTTQGAVRESDLEFRKDRVCVTVDHLASRVCHRRKDARRL